LSFDLVWFLNQEARLAEAKAAKAAKEAKEAKEKRAREAAEQLRRDKATDASTSNKRSPPSSSDEEKEKEKRKRRRRFFCLEWIEASNIMENDGYDGHCRCINSICSGASTTSCAMKVMRLFLATPRCLTAKVVGFGNSIVSGWRGLPWIDMRSKFTMLRD